MVAEKIDANYVLTVVEKNADDTALIRGRLLHFFIFDTLTHAQQDMMVSVMEPHLLKSGEYVLIENGEADYMYVVDEGVFEVSAALFGSFQTRGETRIKQLFATHPRAPPRFVI